MKSRKEVPEVLRLRSESDGHIRKFNITERMDSGGSVICYAANYGSRNAGVLKEFYPLEVHSLVRNAEGQLVHREGMVAERAAFEELTERFLEPYRMLQKVRVEKELTSFIPYIEIYYGCDEDGNRIGTAYLWSQDSKTVSFESLCQEIHTAPKTNPTRKLLQILHCIEELTKCVCEMHCAELLHLDIKPSNFGFAKRGKEILTQNISFFDLDAVCSMYDVPEGKYKESYGFTEPENQSPNHLTDIYAIGATLFHAIIVTKPDDPENSYHQYDYHEDFSKLRSFLDDSALIQASDATSHPVLKEMLLTMFQKTLCLREDRYQSCEELLEDLLKAISNIVPHNVMARGNWAAAMAEEPLDPIDEKKATLALQYHLFSHPLYANMEKEKTEIDLLLIGFGSYGQKFLDVALQAAQMPGKTLHVTVVSASAKDKEIYLKARPELDRFFNIDGSLTGDAGSYGTIDFLVKELPLDRPDAYPQMLKGLLQNGVPTPDYAFVATGQDRCNLAIAEKLDVPCPVHIAWEGKALDHVPEKVIPLYLREDITKKPEYEELERMGFNVHLIWERHFNAGFDVLRKRYKEEYNHVSSISFALSIKYKLYGIGIELKEDNFAEAAKAYRKFIKAEKNKNKLDELIYQEHRRWVTEKLCQGYRQITDLEECATGVTKDKKRKRHVCITRSRPKRTLNSIAWTESASKKPNHKKWDSGPESELDKLDDLDRMSVQLHRMYLKHAQQVRKSNMLLSGGTVSLLRQTIQPDGECLAAFQELWTCMKDIWNQDAEQTKRYRGLQSAFSSVLKNSQVLSDRSISFAQQMAETMYNEFYAVYASQQYHSYKEEDVSLVEGIPFILTYSHKMQLVMPFMLGNNTELFSNLAAPTAINPDRIYYLDFCQDAKRLQKICEAMPYLNSYMKKKHIHAKVEFILGIKEHAAIEAPETIEARLKACSDGRVARVKCIFAPHRRGFVQELEKDLKRKDKGKQPLLLEQNSTVLSGVMEGMGIFDAFPSYAYNSARMAFEVLHDCDVVRYLHAKPYLSVTDMFAFKMSSSTTSNKPEFYAEYRTLWDLYQKYTGPWKYMCQRFMEHAEKHDLLAAFERLEDQRKQQPEVVFEQMIPSEYGKTVNHILDALIAQGLIEEGSEAVSKTMNSCHVVIRSSYPFEAHFASIFSDISRLQEQYIRCETDPKHHIVKVFCNQLEARAVDCKTLAPKGYELIEELAKQGLLRDLSIRREERSVSFIYATQQIKELLTIEGRMLEIFVYHRAKESGGFDDIRCGFEIDWEKSLATNEFDCVLTKGFSVIFVECKATRDLKTEFYTKLSSLVQQFGINATAVIVADTQDNSFTTESNRIQREHGEQFQVITISDREKISDIGHELLKILNGENEQ